MIEIKGRYANAAIMTNDIEESALTQVHNIINNLIATGTIVLQPDVHAGAAGPIGLTMELSEKVVPQIKLKVSNFKSYTRQKTVNIK
jgi:RNA-splicing ligase RtcB